MKMDYFSSSSGDSSDEDLELLLLLRLKRKRRARRKRKFRTHPLWLRRADQGVHDNLVREMILFDSHMFRKYTRISVETYEKLLTLVGPYLLSAPTRIDIISPSQKLMVTLRYCASGESMTSISSQFRMGISTVQGIVAYTLIVIWEILRREVLQTPTAEKFVDVAKDFENLWQFPHTLGAIDGKLVVMQALPKSGSEYFSRKHTHCINLLAACDARYNFTILDVGAKGRQSDGGVFRNSELGRLVLSDSLDVPASSELFDGGPIIPYFFVGDAAFPLSLNMMCPYPGAGTGRLCFRQNVFNYRLSRARRTIENTFGILAARWRIFRGIIIASLEVVKSIVLTTVCLHNFIKKEEESLPEDSQQYCPPNFGDRQLNNGRIISGEWRRGAQMGAFGRLRDVFEEPSDAATVRDQLSYYFVTRGRKAWQEKRVTQGDF